MDWSSLPHDMQYDEQNSDFVLETDSDILWQAVTQAPQNTGETQEKPLPGKSPGAKRKKSEPVTPPFETIFEQHFDYVWSSLRRLGVSADDTEDLAQEVFITIHRRLHTYDPSRPLKPWIFGVTFRVASDFKRLARHRREIWNHDIDPEDKSPGPARKLEQSEARALVIKALQNVEESRRPVFILYEIDNVSMKDVAESLSIPLHTAYSRLRKARKEFAHAVRQLRRKP